MSYRKLIGANPQALQGLTVYEKFLREQVRAQLQKNPKIAPIRWDIFPGDEIAVTQGYNAGRTGKIVKVHPVERRVELEGGLLVSAYNCKLLHPVTHEPVDVQWKHVPLDPAVVGDTAVERLEKLTLRSLPGAAAEGGQAAEAAKGLPLIGEKVTASVQRVRFALQSGEALPLPKAPQTEEDKRREQLGTPILYPGRDTALPTAQEVTFSPDEITALAQQKLQVLEREHYARLRAAHERREERAAQQARQRAEFQHAVWQRALYKVALRLHAREQQRQPAGELPTSAAASPVLPSA